ncbi:putative DNA helicase ino80 [Exophiala xenobiotica]|uniref:Chromatin-remodeling ATPase INO80 n=1 Tax=Lithohypha guttulata TaxID=1690604 RepID=A0ABR0KIR9_9EURO|nr:putative DNA helicase ino80 [Lithohypha guttulata]KAK5329420.1 putative DNA helicase ino80 [Exophiala xenobiotica]
MSTPYEPPSSAHAHPSSRQGSLHQSPGREYIPIANGSAHNPPPQDTRPQSQGKPDRASNPMSLGSILSSSNNEPSPPKQADPVSRPAPPPQPMDSLVKYEYPAQPVVLESPDHKMNGITEPLRPEPKKEPIVEDKPRHIMTKAEKENFAAAIANLEDAEFSDEDAVGFYDHKQSYLQRIRKRARSIEILEGSKKRKRRTYLLDELMVPIGAHAEEAEHEFREKYGPMCLNEINQRDIQSEKERKKDMQRKRRREVQIFNEEKRLADLQKQQLTIEDPEEALKIAKDIQKSKDKIGRTTELLEGVDATRDELEVLPLAPNLEGGTTSSFHLGSEEPAEPPKKKLKGLNGAGNRPKKSKQQKQAEKEAAEAAYAEGWLENNSFHSPISIAPKEEPRLIPSKSSKGKKIDTAQAVVNYDSKGYNQLVEQIIRDMARKDVPKTFKIKQQSLAVKQENMRKTVILASKQARKWQERTNKSMKDTQARAKRVMREMMSFWKRNEREERDMRRMAERKEIEDAKKAEADREANRQRRKLNFLISQTELYSHFIGKRIKTDEIERATDDPDVAASAEKVQDTEKGHTIGLPSSAADMTGKTKVPNFEDLDFDAEDETALQEAAMANAQNAMDEAQARARAFDNDGDDQMAAMDNSDMNFMNPTMAGDVQVTQPNMLQAQLKEYQLKGLNWLVNLYEQGINGILADEMGLGKTIQSISVMGYLAEKHNVWGPFLVIAPASTLHNWQQEITRFVPNLKVLPYWGNAKDRKVLRKFWDRKHISYNQDSEFHVLVTSYQLVVMDAQYFQKVKWQYMILDEAQAIKSSQSSRWKVLLGFNCRNRLLLTGTPIQNNMQELWALLHFIMPTLFDSHDEFSEWFSKDIESHAQSNTKLNQDQLRRLHMILKPFMLRRVKAHVQKELGDKLERDVFCDLSYRQRAYYANLRSKISIMDLIEKASMGDDQDAATLMNLVMQFRKVCNHPDLFERADTVSPFAMSSFAETASFMREGSFVQVGYSIRNPVEYHLPSMLCNDVGRLDIPGPNNQRAGFLRRATQHMFNIFDVDYVQESSRADGAFSWLRFVDASASEVSKAGHSGLLERAMGLKSQSKRSLEFFVDEGYESDELPAPAHTMLNIVGNARRQAITDVDPSSNLARLCSITKRALTDEGYSTFEPAARPVVNAPPIEVSALDQTSITERQNTMFNPSVRKALFKIDEPLEQRLLEKDVDPAVYPQHDLLPPPESEKARYTSISVPSMRRFVTDSGKLAKLDELLRQLKAEGHRVLLYFQMTRMIDLMEEYLTYRNYKYCRLDGSTKLEDRRDTVHDFQTRPEIFIFLLSTRAGGLGINLTSADTVIFYDSDWNPTIDSQAMDRAHRLGQTKQVTVYRLITRGTIEERIRKRAMQKEEVQRVVITGGDGSTVDFNTRSRGENRTKDIAMWLADDDQAAMIEQKEKERDAKEDHKPEKKMSKKAMAAAGAAERRRAKLDMEAMYHEGEGNFDDQSAKASGAGTPAPDEEEVATPTKKKPGRVGTGKSKKAKTAAQRLAIIDAAGDLGMGGGN